MLKNFWYACEFSYRITARPKQILMLNERFVLYRNSQGRVIALKDQCPHRGAALSLGWMEDDCIRCPYHGWKYQADGKCIDIPANQPGASIPKEAHVDSYPVQEKYGFIWLFYGDLPEEKRPPIPSLPEFDDATLRPFYYESKVNTHYTRTLENSLDFTHISIVHGKSFGNAFKKEQKILQYDIEMDDWSVNLKVDFMNYTKPNGIFKYVYFLRPSNSKVESKSTFYLPNINKLEVDFGTGKIVNFVTHIPIDNRTTLVKRIQFRSFLTYSWADPLFQITNSIVSKEDKLVAESQYPHVIPDNITDEIHVSSDALSLAFRKLHNKYLTMNWDLKSTDNYQKSKDYIQVDTFK